MQEGSVTFGPFVLDLSRSELHRDGAPVALGQRALAVLAALAETPGRTVRKSDLLDRAWPGVIVEESNLTVQISALRRALEPWADGQEWIVTVPRVGYRLVVPAATGAQAEEPAIPTLAVLPFADLGGDPEQGWFADGVVSDIIAALSRFRSLAVIARASSFAYRDIDPRRAAEELGVRYVLEGSVRRAGDRLRIGVELVDATTGAQLWGERFDGTVADVFDFQDRITESVATLVEPEILTAEIDRSRRERPSSAAAYDLYLKAFRKVTKETPTENAEAYGLLMSVLELEPDNALALAYAAWALEHRIVMGWPRLLPDDAARCAELARRGLQRAAGDATTMALCGLALLQGAKEYDVGMAALRSALEANPNNLVVVWPAGIGHLHCGNLDTALACFHRAWRLSPRDPFAHIPLCGIAHVEIVLGNYEDALSWAERALALNPSHDSSYWMLIAANAHLGRIDEARRHLAAFRRLTPAATVARIRAGQPAKDPSRIAPILEGLRMAGLPEE